ncbi:methylated-DNA--[protein]-cysteine S-methyltransferase [Caloramator proteoclasticus]|uniref:Methylated-DNA--protein-cysteine methyltransferase n=1 Tax=Caloramator proteoclasticus DSM 10124 TaxID=1121262 RepID=A0A1M5B8F3_9CLOT|nr:MULTISPECIES: methylated-DNA--[protein]-cysteine S-methyltransferase [Caloramator]SHF38577.1 methylated-DNA-[protein]-cysteine S-methyltransferase [Caloramator proteoclasticus DSM 10124]
MGSFYISFYDSPIGLIKIVANEEAIVALDFVYKRSKESENDVIRQCKIQLDEYFKGIRKEFDVNIEINGTDFQKKVWQELKRIPYGQVRSYKDIAVAIGNEKAVRAVGGANNKNKIAIIIPCHRVVGKDGSLTGYAGGLWRKKWLLEHEERNSK